MSVSVEHRNAVAITDVVEGDNNAERLSPPSARICGAVRVDSIDSAVRCTDLDAARCRAERRVPPVSCAPRQR